MKPVAMAVVFAIVGVVVSCGIAWFAANQWTSFSDHWLFSACILPVFGAMGGAWAFTPKADWPPAIGKRFLIALVAGVFAGVGSYTAFALVSLQWNGGVVFADLPGKLLDPKSIPELSTTKSGSTSASGVVVHAVICAAVGTVLPFFWLRRKSV